MKQRIDGSLIVVVVVLCALSAPAAAAEGTTLAPYLTEADAMQRGLDLGVGTASLDGPRTVEVLTKQTWTLVYTAGRAGIAPGGGIRVAMRHVLQWTPPQTEKPKGIGYLTAVASNGAKVRIYIEYNRYRDTRFFERYHPWQNIVEVTFPDQGLAEGDQLRITYGDTSQGCDGIRIQPFDEPSFTFKVYVDPLGNDDYLPLNENPTIDIVAAEPHRLGVVMPSDAVVDEPAWCIVRAEDQYGNPAVSYRGTVRFASTDPKAGLPVVYTFTGADRGVHRFEDMAFYTAGAHTVTVNDGTFKRMSNPVRVAEEAPERRLFWGDLHGHTLHSDGRGSVEQFYDFAERVAGLDFCAVTDHAFQVTEAMWEHSKAVTNHVNRDGRFVTFQAYEWSGLTDVGGDHNIFFLESDPPIHRSRSYYNYRNFQMYHGPEPQVNHVEDIFKTLEERFENRTVFAIPHWGGRRGNPNWHNPRVQRMIEIFSEHRRSEDWATTFLTRGYRLGIMASTDGHFGNPGYGYLKPTYDWTSQEIGMATVGVYAEELTRASMFRALYDRRVYATSGNRIILDVRADGHPMGSEYETKQAPTLTVHAVGTAPIARVEFKKNSDLVHTDVPGREDVELTWQDYAFDPGAACYYYVRIVQEDGEEAISSPIWVN